MEELGESRVRLEIPAPIVGMRPVGMLPEYLAPKLLGDAERLDRSEARDTLAPVGVFGITRRAPISGDELTNSPRDHDLIVARRLTTLQQFRVLAFAPAEGSARFGRPNGVSLHRFKSAHSFVKFGTLPWTHPVSLPTTTLSDGL